MSDPYTNHAGEASLSFGDYRLSNASLTVLAEMGISEPTPIQAAVLPLLLDGRDVIGQARTGSGKTLAFALPLIEVVDPKLKKVQALVLTPTRELAVQVAGVIDELGAPRGLKTLMISGGRAFGPQRDELRRGVHVVVGTPGRVLDLLNQGAIWLDRVRFLVLDEADEMLDRGFAPDVERIIARTTPDRQTALFSATVPSWVKQTASKHLHDPETVTIVPEPGEVDADRASRLRDRRQRQDAGPARPARPSRRWLGDRLRPHQARREQARPPLAGGRLPGGGAAGEPVAERA